MSGSLPGGADLAPEDSKVRSIAARSGRLWEEDELLLVLNSLPPGVQDYSPRHRFVIELAILLDRTPGSVSLHLANYVYLRDGPPHGKSHVGAAIRAVFDEYNPKPDVLRQRAETARARLVSRSLVPRIEGGASSRRQADQQLDDLERMLRGANAPTDAYLAYRRKGSDYVGLLVALYWAMSNPDTVKGWMGIAMDALRGAPTRSEGAEAVLTGASSSLAAKVLERDIPGFHPEELSRSDAAGLANRILEFGPNAAWRLTRKRLEQLRRSRAVDLRRTVSEYFQIDASQLCSFCLGRLLAIRERAEKRRD